MDVFGRHEPVLHNRDLFDRPGPIPAKRIRDLTPDSLSIQKRGTFGSDDDSSSSSSSSSSKETPGGSSTTPIVVGVVVPVVIIAIILLVIWRRRRKITKVEEANDKYKSLDFGIDGLPEEKKGKTQKGPPAPEMSIAELKNTLRKDRGLSMDLSTTNPFVLPTEVHSSRESLQSLSRSINTGDDKYRATTFVPDDGSVRPGSSLKSHGDGSSTWTGSTRHRTGTNETESKTDLIRKPMPMGEKQSGLLAPNSQSADRYSTLSTGSNTAALRASNNYLGRFISGGQKKDEVKKEDQAGLIMSETEVQPTPPAVGQRETPAVVLRSEHPDPKTLTTNKNDTNNGHAVAELADNRKGVKHKKSFSAHHQTTIPVIETTSYEMDASPQSQFPQRTQNNHELGLKAHVASNQRPSVPEINVEQNTHQQNTDHDDDASDYYDDEVFDEYQDHAVYTDRGSMIGQRPLPPDDPSENPEQRANRIRSFYKEYFDDGSKGGPKAHAQPAYYDGSEEYDNFDYGYYEQSHSRGPSRMSDGRHRAFSQGSHAYYPPAPRAYSSMSTRPGPRQKAPAKKKLPPPKPLMALPTPHMLKDDDFLPNAIDYAPPTVFKNQRSGTPDSLRGGLRPYSPSVRPHVPLTSSFDDLPAVPSPHALRKSSTFTGLDFAPPRRFKEPGDSGSGSETGSITSNRSNISRMHLANIRNGAYRVSRIPTDVAGTKDDMFTALKPKWDMRGDGAATPTLR